MVLEVRITEGHYLNISIATKKALDPLFVFTGFFPLTRKDSILWGASVTER